MNLQNNPVVEEILYQGLTDWIGLTTVVSLIEEEAADATPEGVKAETLRLIRYLLDEGLARAGELSNSAFDSGDFLDWPGDTAMILGRITSDWEDLTSLDHFEPCWLRLTDRGREIAQALG
ncbi:hypothetical protein LO771_19835 [Streptacidiphilus sp. ASG 303]|uniref:hypothetical protein n=1 Tax=Streptacidiphilus sp. ASG 303 TaxID=2896847 RepID=UPI001E5C9C66|nr:hypothetical protein [Streptacidiphilus sp. ASG 303]MCD0484584.1 hypothetical protein [Streptacidiphilus sp. ASG 303]